MTPSLESLVQEIVEATQLRGKLSKELISELTSHIIDEERDLQLQGYSEQKIQEIIFNQFKKERMVAEFKQVHNEKLKWIWGMVTIGITLLILNLNVVLFNSFGAPDSSFSESFLRMFFWLGLILTTSIPTFFLPFNFIATIIIILVFNVLKYVLVIRNFTTEKAKIVRNFIIGAGLLLHWIILIVSFEGRHFPEQPTIEGGFPIKVFKYLWTFPSGVGPKWGIPLSPLPRYLIHLGIWSLVAAVAYRLLPERMRGSKRLSTIILIGGLTATLYGFSFLAWQFND